MTISELKNLVEKENDPNKLESLKGELQGALTFRAIAKVHLCTLEEFINPTIWGCQAWILTITSPSIITPKLKSTILKEIQEPAEYTTWISSIQPDIHTLIITYIIG